MSNWPPIAPQNIILKMPNWLGDLVMATAAIADLKNHFPKAKITALCQSNVASLLENNPAIDEIISYKKPSGWIHRIEHYDLIQDIRLGDYNLGVLFTNSFSSAWWFWRGHVKYRLGYGDLTRSLLLTKAVREPTKKATQHLVTTYKEILTPLGIAVSNTAPQLFITEEEKRTARDFLALKGINVDKDLILGINPGAAYGSAKCWLPERFIEVTKKLLRHDRLQVIYFGDQAGKSLVDAICQELPKDQVVNLAGKTSLRELIALIDCCSLFLTNDSGPMHISAALKVPLVALFGSTNDVSTGPYGSGTVIHKHVECSPCYKRECPIDFRCMTRISVDEVYNELETLVKDPSEALK
ncbi:MAG: lipopolysaccharide heptosyltransferase II [Parachlamydiaceae bacterium]|nr:lipopolysaccharide heptosyltransferase II [Parachlamydiaceae bacterium]